MNRRFFSLIRQCVDALYQAANRRLRQWTRPDNHTLLLNVATDLARSKSELVLENAFLRQQLITLQRQVEHPAPTPRDRVLLVLLARKLSSGKQALMIVQPDALLRWHRDLFRRFWKPKSRSRRSGGRPPLTQETIALIKHMAQENHSWLATRPTAGFPWPSAG
jgi:putative transposase